MHHVVTPSTRIASDARFDTERMTQRQIRFWQRLLALPLPQTPDIEVISSTDPIHADEILDQSLYERAGIFAKAVQLRRTPRAASILRVNGTIVAHGLFITTTNDVCGCPPVPPRIGEKAGLIGVYVAPRDRGKGYARRCVAPLADLAASAIGTRHLCVVCDVRIVRWCRSLFAGVAVLGHRRRPDDDVYIERFLAARACA